MKKLILVFLILLLSSSAYAAPLGFLYDAMDGNDSSNITDHTVTGQGGAWAYSIGADTLMVANKADINGSTSTGYQGVFNAATPPTSSYYCQVVCQVTHISSSGDRCDAAVRRTAAADTLYHAPWLGGGTGARTMKIYRRVTGTDTQIATFTMGDTDVAINTDFTIRLEVTVPNGTTNVRLVAYFNGVQKIDVTDTNAARLTGVGQGGWMMASASGQHAKADNVQCDMLRGNGRRIM